VTLQISYIIIFSLDWSNRLEPLKYWKLKDQKAGMMSEKPSRDYTRFTRLTEFGDLELLYAQYIMQVFSPHMHNELAIGMVESGVHTYYYRGATHRAFPGQIVCCNPGEVHTGYPVTEDGWTYRMFYIDMPTLHNAISQITGREYHPAFFGQTVIDDLSTAQQLRRLHITLEQSNSSLERESRWIMTLARLITRHIDDPVRLHPVGSEKEPIARAKNYIEGNYTDNISLDELAQVACLSPYHFLRVFRDTVGLPPHAYLTQVRVMRAKQLLDSKLPIAQIATGTGFTDQSHLTRRFKQMLGITPGQYRNSVQDG
jgi:AraC-like DNA-binding protein